MAKKLYNCHVIGVCSGKNAEFVRHMGADEIVDYTTQDVAKTLLDERPSGRKYDLYIDCVGGVEMFNHWVRQILDHPCTHSANILSMTFCTRMARTSLSLAIRPRGRVWEDLQLVSGMR